MAVPLDVLAAIRSLRRLVVGVLLLADRRLSPVDKRPVTAHILELVVAVGCLFERDAQRVTWTSLNLEMCEQQHQIGGAELWFSCYADSDESSSFVDSLVELCWLPAFEASGRDPETDRKSELIAIPSNSFFAAATFAAVE